MEATPPAANGATIGGGIDNMASGSRATVGGGDDNEVTGSRGMIGGGSGNTASGDWATIPGGSGNVASGSRSFAAGYLAKANHPATFVWSDFNSFDFSSTVENGFFVRCTGGVKFVTGIGRDGEETAGVRVVAGDSAWQTLSDRNAKDNFAPANSREILEKLAALPMTTWNYKAQDPSIRHLGPMAQDFHAAFRLGHDEKHISTIDADGVALAAIQGLHQVVKAQEVRITALEDRNRALEEYFEKLKQHLEPRTKKLAGGAQ